MHENLPNIRSLKKVFYPPHVHSNRLKNQEILVPFIWES